MDNTAAIALLVGAFMPILVSILKQVKLNKWWNLLISTVACGVAGFLTVWARGELDWGNILVATAYVFTASQAVYGAFWRDALDNPINVATSIR